MIVIAFTTFVEQTAIILTGRTKMSGRHILAEVRIYDGESIERPSAFQAPGPAGGHYQEHEGALLMSSEGYEGAH
jgi:hypothetical protein